MSALAAASERVSVIQAAPLAVPPGMVSVAAALPIAGRAVVPAANGELRAVADGNRTVILPDVTAELGGRTWYVAAKGAGALTPLYGGPLDPHTPPRAFLGETWFGEAPFGGQGEINAAMGVEVTALADGGCSIAGFHICPVLQVVELPPEVLRRDEYWYRRWGGRYLQEHRLVPSDVRLFHASERTLGQSPDEVLAAFGVDDAPALDAFVDRFIATGIAALTVYARTLRESTWGVQGLGYGNVWLDKDSVVAPDGALCFADLEGLDWLVAGQDVSLEQRIRDQLEHNLYEFFYGLDVLVRVVERRADRRPSQAERRRSLATRFELALDADPVARVERHAAGLDLVVGAALRPREPVRFRLIDFG